MNAEKKDNSSSLVKEIENTPFRVVEVKDGFVLTLGNTMAVTECFESVEKAEARALATDWEIVSCMAYEIAKEMINNEKTKTK